MKQTLILFGALFLFASCNKSASWEPQVQAHEESLKVLNAKMVEQEKFIEETRRMLAEQRAAILALQDEIKNNAKTPAKKVAEKAHKKPQKRR